jgi:serine/threonine-protein kinase
MMGTPGYMPPEQVRGLVDRIDARSDVWALGATIFVMLTATPLQRAATPQELLVLAMTTSVPPTGTLSARIPPEVSAILDRALAFDPAARFANAGEMRDALRAMQRVPMHATPAPTPAPRDGVGIAGDASPSLVSAKLRRIAVGIGVTTVLVGTLALARRQRAVNSTSAEAAPQAAPVEARSAESTDRASEPIVATSPDAASVSVRASVPTLIASVATAVASAPRRTTAKNGKAATVAPAAISAPAAPSSSESILDDRK